jgi:hypothetical protein
MKTIAPFVLVLATLTGSFAQSLPECGVNPSPFGNLLTRSQHVWLRLRPCQHARLLTSPCLCTDTEYISGVIPCIDSSCDATEAERAYAFVEGACNSVGVTIPPVSSVLSSLGKLPVPAV